jgi:hypothetical protein
LSSQTIGDSLFFNLAFFTPIHFKSSRQKRTSDSALHVGRSLGNLRTLDIQQEGVPHKKMKGPQALESSLNP